KHERAKLVDVASDEYRARGARQIRDRNEYRLWNGPGSRSPGTTANISTARPRESGDPLFPAAILTPGPPLPRGRTEKDISDCQTASFVGPGFGRAWGLPVSFSLPP